MWEGSDKIFPDRVGNFFVYTSWKLGSSLSCKLPIYNICYLIYAVWDRGQGDSVASHRVCWPYHTPKHMAHRHSVRRRTLENMTEMMILICIVLAYKPRFSCARQTLPVWKHNGRALLTLCIRNASALLTRRSRLQCETGVRKKSLLFTGAAFIWSKIQ